MKRDQHNLNFTLTNLSGDQVEYDLVPLRRKQASYVAHTFLRTILKGLSGAMSGGGQAAAILSISEIDFDTIWDLASILLKGAVIQGPDGIEEITDLDISDHFTENPDELYLAVGYGIKENYPKVFIRVREKFGDFVKKFSDKLKTTASKPETSDTA